MEESCDFCFVILWITLYRNLLLILLEDAWLVWWVFEGNAKTLGITIKGFFFFFEGSVTASTLIENQSKHVHLHFQF